MTQFKICNFVQLFAIICITTIEVHADPSSVKDECFRQIKFAFGQNITAPGCFSYAIQYYIKGQNISITDDNFLNEEKEEEKDSYHRKVRELRQKSKYYAGFRDGSLSTYYKKKYNNYDFNEYYKPGSKSKVYDPPTRVTRFEDLVSDTSKGDKNYAMLYHIRLETMINETVTEIIPNRKQFCIKTFPKDLISCMENLYLFGDSAEYALSEAFRNYRLSEQRENVYVYLFLKTLVQESVKIQYDSSKIPLEFCKEHERNESFDLSNHTKKQLS